MEAGVTGTNNPSPFRDQVAPPPATNFSVAYATGLVYVVASALTIALLPPPTSLTFADYLAAGLLMGTLFGQTTAASVWSSLGTGPPIFRAVLLIGWLVLLTAGLAVFSYRARNSNGAAIVLFVCCMILQSLAIQVPLCILRRANGVGLRSGGDKVADGSERIQFGIRHLMAFTAVVAVVLGVGQALIRWGGGDSQGPLRELPAILYLALAAVLLSLPIGTAILMRRHQVIGLVLAFLFAFIVTCTENSMTIALGLQKGGPDISLLAIIINVVTALHVATYCEGLRRFGFRLTISPWRPTITN